MARLSVLEWTSCFAARELLRWRSEGGVSLVTAREESQNTGPHVTSDRVSHRRAILCGLLKVSAPSQSTQDISAPSLLKVYSQWAKEIPYQELLGLKMPPNPENASWATSLLHLPSLASPLFSQTRFLKTFSTMFSSMRRSDSCHQTTPSRYTKLYTMFERTTPRWSLYRCPRACRCLHALLRTLLNGAQVLVALLVSLRAQLKVHDSDSRTR